MSDASPQTPPEPISLAQRRAHGRLFRWLFSPIDADPTEEHDDQPRPEPIRPPIDLGRERADRRTDTERSA